MTLSIILFITGVVLFALLLWAYHKSKKPVEGTNIPEAQFKKVLHEKVSFYDNLKPADKKDFLNRVKYFISRIRITPVQGVELTNPDRILVAAAAVIPLFRFTNWFYNNLNEILVYPGSFNRDFELEGGVDQNIIGMVGDGAMHRTMILSLHALRAGFSGNSKNNTAIHEFAHLLDKADGSTDGVPELILQQENVKPWIQLMHRYIAHLRNNRSDIDPYGATNEAEFFAVMSEYFFQRPEKLKENHPQLYEILEEAFSNAQN